MSEVESIPRNVPLAKYLYVLKELLDPTCQLTATRVGIVPVGMRPCICERSQRGLDFNEQGAVTYSISIQEVHVVAASISQCLTPDINLVVVYDDRCCSQLS